MNYLPYISWWMYGGADADQRANFFVSYGLMEDLPTYGLSFVKRFGQWFWEFIE